MKIKLNNKYEEFPGKETMSVRELLSEKKFSYKLLIVRINNKGVAEDKYELTMIRDGDEVMVLHLITGG